MIPSAFDYVRASSLDDALAQLGDGSKVLAGGQSILPLMKLRLARPARLVDIGRLTELRGLRRLPDSRVVVGALTTYADLMESPLMQHDVLSDALPTIGDVQVRNRGTIGGAIAHADPASDLPAAVLALGGTVVLRKRGTGVETGVIFEHVVL
jgi:carbon-monoxide dehydrogenase medium subunit